MIHSSRTVRSTSAAQMNITKILTYSMKNGHATSWLVAVKYVRVIHAVNSRNRTWLRVSAGLPYHGGFAARSGAHSPNRHTAVEISVMSATGSDQLMSEKLTPNTVTQS